MIYIAMPVGLMCGWGSCGRYLSRHLADLTAGKTKLIPGQIDQELIDDEDEWAATAPLILLRSELAELPAVNGVVEFDGPLLLEVTGVETLLPNWMGGRGTRTVGYTFFENTTVAPIAVENARRNYDVLVAGSTWCASLLRQHGLTAVATVIQGIDPLIFNQQPASARSPELKDKFVVFSGGKFELRKGQDVVIRAYQVLQDRHPDVVLVNSWFNPWPDCAETMRGSKLIRCYSSAGPYVASMNQVLADNGIDIARVQTLGPQSNRAMAEVYRNSDVGLFPNRCEGGTNLVLMEYMACGKPVIATATTGHADIVNQQNALLIHSRGETRIVRGQTPIALWPEPDLEDTIEKLEWAYQHRDELGALGQQAGEDLSRRTWHEAAKAFYKLLLE